MIISISPPSSISLRSLEKQTEQFFNCDCTISRKRNCLLVIRNDLMVLVKKREILLSFSEGDIDAILFLRNYLLYLFEDVYIGVDFRNPITDDLKSTINLPLGVVS